MTHVIINGVLTPLAAAFIPVQDRSFRYGDGVFETLEVYAGVAYQFEWHLARLNAGLQALRIKCDLGRLQQDCRTLLRANSMTNGMLRIHISRGVGSLGYLPDESHLQAGAMTVIETLPSFKLPAAPISLWKSNYHKISQQALPVRYKLAQGVNSILARMEAADNDCFDALLLNAREQLCETSSGNIFWLKDGVLYTPALSCGLLEGATRGAVLRLWPHASHELEASVEVILQADAVIITNSAWRALAVARLEPLGAIFDSIQFSKQINLLLQAYITSYTAQHKNNW